MGLGSVMPSPRRQMNLFFLLDTSGSMDGAKMQAVNESMREIINDILPEIDADNKDNAEIMVSCLEFSDDVEWVYPSPMNAEDFKMHWEPLETKGLTSFGAALSELNDKMSTQEYMSSPTGHLKPAVILMSDGIPTDEYKKPLAQIQQNSWFKQAYKIAISAGNDSDLSVLAEFTGNKELVLTVHNIVALKKIMVAVSATVSKIASRTTTDGADTLVEEIREIAEEDPTVEIGTEPTQWEDEWS